MLAPLAMPKAVHRRQSSENWHYASHRVGEKDLHILKKVESQGDLVVNKHVISSCGVGGTDQLHTNCCFQRQVDHGLLHGREV